MGRIPVPIRKELKKVDNLQAVQAEDSISAGVMRIALGVLVLLLFLVFGKGCAHAQQMPDAPQPKQQVHVFTDALNMSNFFATVTGVSAEVGQACNVDNVGRQVCGRLQIAGAGFVAVSVVSAYALHKTGHHTMERVVPAAVTLFHIGRMAYVSFNRAGGMR